MARHILKNESEITTRNKYTRVNMAITFSVDGRELPTMAILGGALEKAIDLIQKEIEDSYKEIPPRVNEPSTGGGTNVTVSHATR